MKQNFILIALEKKFNLMIYNDTTLIKPLTIFDLQ